MKTPRKYRVMRSPGPALPAGAGRAARRRRARDEAAQRLGHAARGLRRPHARARRRPARDRSSSRSQRTWSTSQLTSAANCTSPAMRTGGLSPRSAACASDQGDSSVTVSVRSGAAAAAGQVEQAGRRGDQPHREDAPARLDDAAGLAAQPLLRLRLLHQHVIEQQHQAVLDLVHRPGRRRQALAERGRTGRRGRKGKAEGVAMSPDYAGAAGWPQTALLQGLHARHQPAARSRPWAWSCSRLRGTGSGRPRAPRGSSRRTPRWPCSRRPGPRCRAAGPRASRPRSCSAGRRGAPRARPAGCGSRASMLVGHHRAQGAPCRSGPRRPAGSRNCAWPRRRSPSASKPRGHAPGLRARQGRADLRRRCRGRRGGLERHGVAVALPGTGRGVVADLVRAVLAGLAAPGRRPRRPGRRAARHAPAPAARASPCRSRPSTTSATAAPTSGCCRTPAPKPSECAPARPGPGPRPGRRACRPTDGAPVPRRRALPAWRAPAGWRLRRVLLRRCCVGRRGRRLGGLALRHVAATACRSSRRRPGGAPRRRRGWRGPAAATRTKVHNFMIIPSCVLRSCLAQHLIPTCRATTPPVRL